MPGREPLGGRALVMAEEAIREGHYREILARLEGMSTRIDETRADAREARDAAKVLTERFNSQDVPKQLAELKASIEKSNTEHRSDLVNSIDKVTREVRDNHKAHGDRLEALETFKNRVEGARGLLGWVSKHAPWLAALVLLIGGVVMKDKLP